MLFLDISPRCYCYCYWILWHAIPRLLFIWFTVFTASLLTLSELGVCSVMLRATSYNDIILMTWHRAYWLDEVNLVLKCQEFVSTFPSIICMGPWLVKPSPLVWKFGIYIDAALFARLAAFASWCGPVLFRVHAVVRLLCFDELTFAGITARFRWWLWLMMNPTTSTTACLLCDAHVSFRLVNLHGYWQPKTSHTGWLLSAWPSIIYVPLLMNRFAGDVGHVLSTHSVCLRRVLLPLLAGPLLQLRQIYGAVFQWQLEQHNLDELSPTP